jgi:hypothetical protein
MVDITEVAKEAGLRVRTLLTPAAWEVFNEGGQIQGPDLRNKLSLMLATLHIALTQRKGPKQSVIHFSARLGNRGNPANRLVLKATIENHAPEQSVITVMLPAEGGGGKTPGEEGGEK